MNEVKATTEEIGKYQSLLYETLNKETERLTRLGDLLGEETTLDNLEKEKAFLLNSVPNLFPLFLNRWTNLEGFYPCKIVEKDKKIDLNSKDSIKTIHSFDIIRPNFLTLIDGLAKKELGYLPIKINDDTLKSLNYINILSEVLFKTFSKKIAENLESNAEDIFKSNSPNTLSAETNRYKSLDKFLEYIKYSVEKEIISATNFNNLVNPFLAEISFSSFEKYVKNNSENIKSNCIHNKYIHNIAIHSLKQEYKNVRFHGTELHLLAGKLKALNKDEIYVQLQEILDPLKEHIKLYEDKKEIDLLKQVNLIRQDLLIANEKAFPLEK